MKQHETKLKAISDQHAQLVSSLNDQIEALKEQEAKMSGVIIQKDADIRHLTKQKEHKVTLPLNLLMCHSLAFLR